MERIDCIISQNVHRSMFKLLHPQIMQSILNNKSISLIMFITFFDTVPVISKAFTAAINRPLIINFSIKKYIRQILYKSNYIQHRNLLEVQYHDYLELRYVLFTLLSFETEHNDRISVVYHTSIMIHIKTHFKKLSYLFYYLF